MVSQCHGSNSTGRTRRRIFCPHCEELVSKTTFYRHRDNHFDVRKNEWKKEHYYVRDIDSDIDSSSDNEDCDMTLHPVPEPQSVSMSEDLLVDAPGPGGEH